MINYVNYHQQLMWSIAGKHNGFKLITVHYQNNIPFIIMIIIKNRKKAYRYIFIDIIILGINGFYPGCCIYYTLTVYHLQELFHLSMIALDMHEKNNILTSWNSLKESFFYYLCFDLGF